MNELPQRNFGSTSARISALGMGGHHLGDAADEETAIQMVHDAVDGGITFFDNCWEYNRGKSENWMGKGLRGLRDQVFLMTKVCTHGRDGTLAMQMLEESLRRLQTDYLDLWQIHGVSFDNDPHLFNRKGGAAEALEKAKKEGKVRFVGFTGHKAPEIHLKMMATDFPFDSVQMPLNAFDANFHSFEKLVLPEVNRRGMAALGMKPMNGKCQPVRKGVITAEQALRYAMSLPVATTISGMDRPEVLKANLQTARSFQPMSASEMEAMRKQLQRPRRRRTLRAVQGFPSVRQSRGQAGAQVSAGPAGNGGQGDDEGGGKHGTSLSGDQNMSSDFIGCDTDRRHFIKGAALAGIGATLAGGISLAQTPAETPSSKLVDLKTGQVPKRPLGKTGLQVSAMGLGGFHLGSAKNQDVVNEIVSRAVDAGINFFDNAWEYHDGDSEVRVGKALKGKRDNVIIMTKVCTHGRGSDVAMSMLEDSLKRLKTDHIDVWQIHEVVYYNDPDLIFAKGGVAEALLLAKQQGKVRFVGFTGHKDPAIHLEMLAHDFPFDTIQMPLNCFDANYHSFERNVLPVAIHRGLGILGMKSLGGGGEMVTSGSVTPAEGLGYAMSLPVSTTISGIESLYVLEQNLDLARDFKPFSEEKMADLRERCRELAADGHLEKFKTTKFYDGDLGREQHGYPSAKELPV